MFEELNLFIITAVQLKFNSSAWKTNSFICDNDFDSDDEDPYKNKNEHKSNKCSVEIWLAVKYTKRIL